MRLTLSMLAIVLATFALDSRADAQNYPWCAQYSGVMGGAMNCGFVSFAQCMADVSGIGGFCMLNNRYQPPLPAAAARHQARQRHGRKNS